MCGETRITRKLHQEKARMWLESCHTRPIRVKCLALSRTVASWHVVSEGSKKGKTCIYVSGTMENKWLAWRIQVLL